MRDKIFIAEHRGGTLKKEQQKQLMIWACSCVENVLPLIGEHAAQQLKNVLQVCKDWVEDKATVGEARKASLKAITVANESSNLIVIAVARAAGHAVATAHMADHALGAALYALKAVKMAGRSVDAERKWQNEQLPSEIKDLVLSTRGKKEKALKIE
jgi:hypothetical protein